MKKKKKYVKKPWVKPQLTTLQFNETAGGTLTGYPESFGGSAS